MANLAMDEGHSDGDVFYAGAVTDTDKLNGYSRAINNNTDYHQLWNQSQGDSVKLVSGNSAQTVNSIAAVSDVIWIASINHGTDLYRTADGGATWAIITHELGEASLGIIACATDPTKMLVWGDTQISFSNDSGASFAVSTTDPPNCTALFDMTYPTTTLAIASGNSSSDNSAWICTDPITASTWAHVNSSSTTNAIAVHMPDATHGLMIIADTKCLRTVDGDDWTDTTKVSKDVTVGGKIFCKTNTTGIQVANHATELNMEIYANANFEYTLYLQMAGYIGSNIIKTTNGNYYCVIFPNATITDTGIVILLKSLDAGLTWSNKVIGAVDNNLGASDNYGQQLTEYDTNKLLFGAGNFICTINESFTGAA